MAFMLIVVAIISGVIWHFIKKSTAEMVDEDILNDPAIPEIIHFCGKCQEISNQVGSHNAHCGAVFVIPIGYDGAMWGNPALTYRLSMNIYEGKNEFYLWKPYFYENADTSYDNFYNNPERWINAIDTDKIYYDFRDSVSIEIDKKHPDNIVLSRIVVIRSTERLVAFTNALIQSCQTVFPFAHISIAPTKTGFYIYLNGTPGISKWW